MTEQEEKTIWTTPVLIPVGSEVDDIESAGGPLSDGNGRTTS